MKRRRTLRTAIAAALAAAFSFLTLASASAIEGYQYWNESVPSGWASGSVYISGSQNKWSVSGTLRDNRSGDDCTKAYVYAVTFQTASHLYAERRVCGGLSTSISASGVIYRTANPDYKYLHIKVCQDRTAYPDDCEWTQRYYLQ